MATDDVLVVGGGPAGAVAALVLSRAGARVRVIERARFPRDKLCGDTVNPGTLALLVRLAAAHQLERRALAIHGMRVTGASGVVIEGRYPPPLHGLAVTRRDLDAHLLEEALGAGARLDELRVTEPIVERGAVRGVRALSPRGTRVTLTSPLTIAADGRRSTLAFGLGLAFHPRRPRRWAIGAYYEGVTGLDTLGEMHLRGTHYVGVAPLSGGLANVCLVLPLGQPPHSGRDPRALLPAAIAGDRLLSPRFERARPVTEAAVLGPLAVEATAAGVPGLLLAGDAAGFIDPMTGDGLRFAIRGAQLAASAALDGLAAGPLHAHLALALARRHAFAGKQVFNRALRRLVDSPMLPLAARGARVAPEVVRAAIRIAGDVPR
jgi:flavin-dependent dehydrogenase